jgi:hypothetical protein
VAELAVSQDGVLIEYLTVPVDALTRYSIRDGENGPPGGPEKARLLDGVTINDGEDCPAGLCAGLISVDNSIAGMPSTVIEASRHAAMAATLNVKTMHAECHKIFGDIFFLAFGLALSRSL